MTVLKPCPFCGGEASVVKQDVEPQGDPFYGTKMETFVKCECGCCLFNGYFHEGFYDGFASPDFIEEQTAEQSAITAWNTRANEQQGGT